MTARSDEDAFYERLFVESPRWNTRFPNYEEAPRAAVLLQFLTRVTHRLRRNEAGVRILDLGCGRGWLTYIASAYGECLGVDPVAPVVEFAARLFPECSFRVGTAPDLLPEFANTFDVVVASEVIEHVPPEARPEFVTTLKALLTPTGSAIISTDRGELYERWMRTRPIAQPVESWLTEAEVRHLFESGGFRAVAFDRVYWDAPELSFVHRLAASRRVERFLSATRQQWLQGGLRYLAGFGQVWLFDRRTEGAETP